MSDAILIFSFGGPEKNEDVMEFLENVVAGRNIPRERLLSVAGHYYHFGGKSPINDHNRMMIAALRELLAEQGPALPVYWGNRNWHPYLEDTLRTMKDDGVRRCLVFATSAFGSYSGCRRYLEDLERASNAVGPGCPEILKLRLYYNHPGFIEPMVDHVRAAVERIPESRRLKAVCFFTAHSVPVSMADASPYVEQLREACRLVATALHLPSWELVFQSRSGPPSQPWLEPDVLDSIRSAVAGRGASDIVLVPVGFVSDHMEVLYDLDTEAKALCDELGVHMVRARTAGGDPRFVAMIRDLVMERMDRVAEKKVMGDCGAAPDVCAPGCCVARAGSPVSR